MRSAIKPIIIIILTAVCVAISFFGWKDLYKHYLERTPPKLEIFSKPRGLTALPATLSFKVTDNDSGLDELEVSLRQSTKNISLLPKKKLLGANTQTVSLTFLPEQISPALINGTSQISIIAKDKSFWGSTTELSIPVTVDYTPPSLAVLDYSNIINQDELNLLFYRTQDEELSNSGVTINGYSFIGFPARYLDQDFEDQNLFVVPYVVSSDNVASNSNPVVSVFSEDLSGNTVNKTLEVTVKKLEVQNVTLKLSEGLLRTLTARVSGMNLSLLESFYRATKRDFPLTGATNQVEQYKNYFNLLTQDLYRLNNANLESKTSGFRTQNFWKEPFSSVSRSSLKIPFGSIVNYMFNEVSLGSAQSLFEIRNIDNSDSSVTAAANGIVSLIENYASYGRTVGIDHGLGVTSIYTALTDVNVTVGEAIQAGQTLGTATINEDNTREYGIGLRLFGIPVNPREFLSYDAFNVAITKRINELKRKLGIPIRF